MTHVIRFTCTVLLLLLALFLVWYGLKIYGKSLTHSDFQTPLIKKIKQQGPILWTSDIQSPHPSLRAHFANQDWWVGNGDKKTRLASLLPLKSAKIIILHLQFQSPKAIPRLRKIMNQHVSWQKTLFCSNVDGLLNDLRKIEPLWSYCSGEIFLTRMLGFSSIGLESIQKIRADAFYFHLDKIDFKTEFQSIIEEAHRQNRVVIAGPVTRPIEGYSLDGWVLQSNE